MKTITKAKPLQSNNNYECYWCKRAEPCDCNIHIKIGSFTVPITDNCKCNCGRCMA